MTPHLGVIPIFIGGRRDRGNATSSNRLALILQQQLTTPCRRERFDTRRPQRRSRTSRRGFFAWHRPSSPRWGYGANSCFAQSSGQGLVRLNAFSKVRFVICIHHGTHLAVAVAGQDALHGLDILVRVFFHVFEKGLTNGLERVKPELLARPHAEGIGRRARTLRL